MHVRLLYPRWYFPYNLGDTVLLSGIFEAISKVLKPGSLELISDNVTTELFFNDPNLSNVTVAPKWLRSKKMFNLLTVIPGFIVVWPKFTDKTVSYFSRPGKLDECSRSPFKNIITMNYALQVNNDVVGYYDLRPKLYLTKAEIKQAKELIPPNSIGIHIARLRSAHNREDDCDYRYDLEKWRKVCETIRTYMPNITIFEIGSPVFLGIGDRHIFLEKFRETAAIINQMRLVILSDGGVHHLCTAVDKKVLLFQSYENGMPDYHKFHNAIFNEKYHLECRKRCGKSWLVPFLKTEDVKYDCNRECYNLDPIKLADDCIDYLRSTLN